MSTRAIKINRAPVLTLWAAVVAERLGLDWEEALTLGRAGQRPKRLRQGRLHQLLRRPLLVSAPRSTAVQDSVTQRSRTEIRPHPGNRGAAMSSWYGSGMLLRDNRGTLRRGQLWTR